MSSRTKICYSCRQEFWSGHKGYQVGNMWFCSEKNWQAWWIACEIKKSHKCVCSRGCKDAETLFNLWMSDEEINRRPHYRCPTSGGVNEQ